MLWLKLIGPFFFLLSIVAQHGITYKWHDKRTKWHRRIRSILLISQVIAALFTIIVVIGDHKTLEKQIDKLQEELRGLKDQVTALSDRLSPFVQFATKEYPNLQESAALDRLAKEIDAIKKLAEPNKLVMVSHDVKKINSGYSVIIYFLSTKNEQLGMVVILATLPQNSQERILDLRPNRAQGLFIGFGDKTKQISEDGRSARLTYKPLALHPAVDLEVSGPTRVRVEVSPGISPYEIDIM